jgi:hypothetical protein
MLYEEDTGTWSTGMPYLLASMGSYRHLPDTDTQPSNVTAAQTQVIQNKHVQNQGKGHHAQSTDDAEH